MATLVLVLYGVSIVMNLGVVFAIKAVRMLKQWEREGAPSPRVAE